MSDPSLELQKALFRALRATSLAGVVGDRVFDQVPSKPPAEFPYVTIGDDQVIGDDDDGCAEGSEIIARVHGWSRAVGYPQVKAIAGAIRAAVMGGTLTLPGFTIVVREFVQTQFLQDPDGLTRHSVTEFRFLIQHD